MRKHLLLAAALMAAAPLGRVRAQALPPVLGSAVDVQGRTGNRLRGELLATTRDTLWVLGANGLVATPLASVLRVRIPYTGGVSRSKVGLWGLVSGITTGVLLTGACATVEDADCAGVLPATLLVWGIVTGVSVALAGQPSAAEFRPTQFEALRAYARFPQGLPLQYRSGSRGTRN